ncbi:nucleotidyl transferase AbiEii/AbiGii toxin family protein [candidate division KSB1 bacterium]|nr:nucleotidyl transferase AbiEii/AbiGii toxin family protein [candidate division KSB1 bacterium]
MKEKSLVLKGGTAINYFYRNLPRLSVDIDLSFLPIESREKSLQSISQSISRITENLQYTIPGIRIILRKSTSSDLPLGFIVILNNVTVKVEINTVIRGSVFSPENASLCENASSILESNIEMKRLSIPDLYGGKICAALDRQHPRDLFDIKLLLENEGFITDIRKAFIVYLISHQRPMSELLNPNLKDIRPVFENELQGMTFEPVALKNLIDTRDELIRLIRTDLTEKEREFILSVKAGQPEWNVLGIDGISQLPAVRWKLENLKQMDDKKRIKAIEKLRRYLQL